MRRYLTFFIQRTSCSRNPVAMFLTPVVIGLVAGLGFLYLGPLHFSRPAAAGPPAANAPAERFVLPEAGLLAPSLVATQTGFCPIDIVVAFDVSASTEFATTCYDCWVRTDPDNPDYPNNGYFNPLPYNPKWADTDGDGRPDVPMSIPHSDLCVSPPAAISDFNGDLYLSHEAELYSRNRGDWRFAARTAGQGFWVLQRGSRAETDAYNPYDDDPTEYAVDLYPHYQGNQAGVVSQQSSNVCHPGLAGDGVECTINGDDICDSSDGNNTATAGDTGSVGGVDCSAYIKAHPFATYGARNNASLRGAAYNSACWTQARCWNSNSLDDPTRPSPTSVPSVEYDFTPRWSGDTHIWIRAIAGGNRSTRWAGEKVSVIPALWRTAVHWEVHQGTPDPANVRSFGETDDGSNNPPGGVKPPGIQAFRDNRAEEDRWRWIRLGTVSAAQDSQHTLRIYQGSAGFKIDKIVFTNSNNPHSILNSNDGKGPPATNGSATREACNLCNPAYGLNIADFSECGCPANAAESNDYINTGTGGSGSGCSAGTGNRLENDLYRGLEPLRSAQEAVKDFARHLDPQRDQLGVVVFGTDVKEKPLRSADLHCSVKTNGACEAESPEAGFRPVLQAVERQWPENRTNISGGLRQGLVELGVAPFAGDLNCSGAPTSSCGRVGVRKILILMTDGAPTARAYADCKPGKIDPDTGEAILDLWNEGVSADDANYECAVYYAKVAADAGVILYTIGIGADVDPDLLTAMAEGRIPGDPNPLFAARGGKFFDAASPTDLDNIFTQFICSPAVIQQATLNGPTNGLVDVSYSFTAAVEPATAPVTYTWQATGQTPLTRTGGVSDALAFSWTAPGHKVITVTARNTQDAVVSATHSIFIAAAPVPLTRVTLEGPPTGTVQTAAAFIAAVAPPTATWPFTYVWQATGQTPLTRTSGLSDTVSFTWTAPGSKTIMVSAANPAGTPPVTAMHTIDIAAAERAVYLPLILKEAAQK